MNVTIAMTTDFMAAKERLPKSIQKKVRSFLDDYNDNPRAPGFNFEKIRNAASDKLRSIRIDQKYRAIVQQEKKGNVLICLKVDNHDEAYEWAQRVKLEVHPDTGVIQIFRINKEYDKQNRSIELPKNGLFALWKDRQLRRLGVPEDLIPLVRSFKTKEDLSENYDQLPDDAFIMLDDLADGAYYEDLVRERSNEAERINSFEDSLYHSKAKGQFVIIDHDTALREMIQAPLEEWRIYLHPNQRRLVKMNARGPMRVLGGAGTGKTVVAMHRAKRLATEVFCEPEDRILFLAFSKNLVADLRANLEKMCTPEAMTRIEVINIDAWVSRHIQRRGIYRRIAYDTDKYWQKAIEDEDLSSPFFKSFIKEEFRAVVLANGIQEESKYLRVSRKGRGKGLHRKQRRELWKIFEAYRKTLSDIGCIEKDDAMYELRQTFAAEPPGYRSVIVDEAQDLSAEAMRLIRAIVPEGEGNDLMIVGDAHQRIYGRPLVLSRCGINIRGRSRRLRLNYRTPEEVRACAVGVLAGVRYDDLDGSHDTVKGYVSLIRGKKPIIRHYTSWKSGIDGILEYIRVLGKDNKWHQICLVAYTNDLVSEYKGALNYNDIPTVAMTDDRADDLSVPGVRIGTMHRVKGLEFDHMIVASVNEGILPHWSALSKATNTTEEAEVERMARSLLYVACTRTRKTLFIASQGAPSPLLEQLELFDD